MARRVLRLLPWPDLIPALAELRRVTRPGGYLRVLVPDLLAAVHAYEVGKTAHFVVADRVEASIDGKLCVYLSQAGSTRSVFTARWLQELLYRAGWAEAWTIGAGETGSELAGIVELDSREHESIIIEARR